MFGLYQNILEIDPLVQYNQKIDVTLIWESTPCLNSEELTRRLPSSEFKGFPLSTFQSFQNLLDLL